MYYSCGISQNLVYIFQYAYVLFSTYTFSIPIKTDGLSNIIEKVMTRVYIEAVPISTLI